MRPGPSATTTAIAFPAGRCRLRRPRRNPPQTRAEPASRRAVELGRFRAQRFVDRNRDGGPFDDREAEPDAALCTRPRRVGAREAVEDVRERVARYAAALVRDLDHRAGAG